MTTAVDEGVPGNWGDKNCFGGWHWSIFRHFRHRGYFPACLLLLCSNSWGVAAVPFHEHAVGLTLVPATCPGLSNAEIIITSAVFIVCGGFTIALTVIASRQAREREVFARAMLPTNCVSLIVAFDSNATLLVELW